MFTLLHGVTFSLYELLSPLYVVLIQFYVEALSLYEVHISLNTVVNSLRGAFFLRGFFPDICGAFLIVCGTYVHGASLSLDLKRGPGCPRLNCGVYRHFERPTCIKFRLSTVSEKFSPKRGSYVEFFRYAEREI